MPDLWTTTPSFPRKGCIIVEIHKVWKWNITREKQHIDWYWSWPTLGSNLVFPQILRFESNFHPLNNFSFFEVKWKCICALFWMLAISREVRVRCAVVKVLPGVRWRTRRGRFWKTKPNLKSCRSSCGYSTRKFSGLKTSKTSFSIGKCFILFVVSHLGRPAD